MTELWTLAVAQWRWMGVNWVLAVVPVLLAVLVARTDQRSAPARTPLRWPLWILVVLLLPNTPYLLTDLRHLPTSVQQLQGQAMEIPLPVLIVTLALCYGVLTVTGSIGYLVVLQLLRVRWRRYPRPIRCGMELALHTLCAVGIWLGHTTTRANSWDVWQRPRWLVEQGWPALTTPTGLVVTPLLAAGLALLSAVLLGVLQWAMDGGHLHHQLPRLFTDR